MVRRYYKKRLDDDCYINTVDSTDRLAILAQLRVFVITSCIFDPPTFMAAISENGDSCVQIRTPHQDQH